MTRTHLGLVQNGRVDRTRLHCDGWDLHNVTAGFDKPCPSGVLIDVDPAFLEGRDPDAARQLQLDAFIRSAHWTTVHIAGEPDRHYCARHTPEPSGEEGGDE